MIRSTHTLAELQISEAAYKEIEAAFKAAQYDHVFLDDGMIDMTGIGLTIKPKPEVIKPNLQDTLAKHGGAPHWM